MIRESLDELLRELNAIHVQHFVPSGNDKGLRSYTAVVVYVVCIKTVGLSTGEHKVSRYTSLSM